MNTAHAVQGGEAVRTLLVGSLSALLAVGCGQVLTLPKGATAFRDPAGDATGSVGTLYDVTDVTVTRDTNQVTIEVTFTQPVALPPPGASATSVQFAGLVDFDLDQNAATGLPSCTPGVGAERFVDLLEPRNLDGTYDVEDTSSIDVGIATVSVSGDTLTVAVTPSALAGDDLRFNLAVAAGNGSTPTDCAPDAAVITRWPARR